MGEPTFKIVRFYRDDRPAVTQKHGLSLEEAQAHCSRDDTRGDGWFDGYLSDDPGEVTLPAGRKTWDGNDRAVSDPKGRMQ